MVPPLPFADAGDIVRASTKDEEYITLLETSIREFLLCILPNSTISSPTASRLTSTASRLLYFLTPIRQGIPSTPGEEHAALVPVRVTRSSTTLPSRRVLVALALSQVIRMEDARILLRGLWNEAGGSASLFPSAAAGALLENLKRLHMAVFYLCGVYHDGGHRATGVRYMRVAPRDGLDRGRHMRFLGVIAMLQVVMDVVHALRKAVRKARIAGCANGMGFVKSVWEAWVWPVVCEEVDEEGRGNCILCLGGMKDATLTTCGHVFCWRCICNWCSSNVSCAPVLPCLLYDPKIGALTVGLCFLSRAGSMPIMQATSHDEKAFLFVQLLNKQ